MSTPIAAVVLASPSRKSVRLNTYVSTEKEGQKKGDRFVAQSGINGCIPEFAERQMRDNRKRWGKDGEREVTRNGRRYREGQYVQAYHVIQSFARDGAGALDPSNPDDWERAHDLGVALAKKLAGTHRLATVTTQIDGKTGCIHNHVVIDSVEKTTGRSFNSANVKHAVLAKAHDELLTSLGYEQQNVLCKGKEIVEKGELRGLAAHEAWEAARHADGTFDEDEPFSVAVLKARVRDALEDGTFTDFESFSNVAIQHGVLAEQRGEKGRGITYAMMRDKAPFGDDWRDKVPGDRRRASKLGRDYMMDAVEAAIERNRQAQATTLATVQAPSPARSTNVPQKHEEPAPVRALPTLEPVMSDEEMREAGRRFRAEILATLERDEHENASSAAAPDDHRDLRSAPVTEERSVHDEPPSSAAAADTGNDVVRAAPAVEQPQFRSLLRDVKVRDQKRQELIDAVAAFDEHAVDLLEHGGMFADSDVPAGIGRKFLDHYEDKIDPEVFFLLDQRQQKKDLATRFWDRSTKMPETIRDELRQKARRLREEVRMGNYAIDDTKTSQKPTQRDSAVVQPEDGVGLGMLPGE